MRSLDVGSVCVKTAGREAGKKVVVVDIVDDNFVLIEGAEVQKRKCNVAHLFPLGKKIKITKGVSQKEIAEKIEG